MLKEHIFMAGPVVYPLLFCSGLVLAMIVERLLVLLFYPPVKASLRYKQFCAGEISGKALKRGLLAGLQYLEKNQHQPKEYREEILSLWLQGERRKLLAFTRWLMLLGVLTPLLGLLGTVLGIITMFQDVAHQTGPVTPALLASGMWEAMVTTAIGIIIAIPALAGSHAFTIWADWRIANMEEVLNKCSLSLEGVKLDQVSSLSNKKQKVIKPAAFQSPQQGELA